ncbi:MAG: hypothetical protein LBR79_03435 [Oscillospiraceae bacterium]|nr:hypothetical protein [Oscillospiraceae bacterium]
MMDKDQILETPAEDENQVSETPEENRDLEKVGGGGGHGVGRGVHGGVGCSGFGRTHRAPAKKSQCQCVVNGVQCPNAKETHKKFCKKCNNHHANWHANGECTHHSLPPTE